MADQEEILFWKTIVSDRKAGPAEFQAYLDAYPMGRFSGLAELRLKRYQPIQISRPGLAAEIVEIAARLGGVPVAWLLSSRRARRLARIRQVAMAVMRDVTQLSYPQIGQALGNRDHTTVMHALRKIKEFEDMPAKTPDAQATLDLLSALRNALSQSGIQASVDSISAMAAQ